MAMSGAVLGAAMKAACSISPNPGESMDDFRTRLFEAMATAIVTHITTLAVVSVSTVGVMAGPATLPGVGNVS